MVVVAVEVVVVVVVSQVITPSQSANGSPVSSDEYHDPVGRR